jgi:hypothetical protein
MLECLPSGLNDGCWIIDTSFKNGIVEFCHSTLWPMKCISLKNLWLLLYRWTLCDNFGTNKGILEKHIRLKIFSPNVVNITLVDVPILMPCPWHELMILMVCELQLFFDLVGEVYKYALELLLRISRLSKVHAM